VLPVIGFGERGAPLALVYWTDDAGDHWRRSRVPTAGPAGSVGIAGAVTAWVIGSHRSGRRMVFDRVLRTADGGRHWQLRTLPFDADGYQLDTLSPKVAYAVRPYPGRAAIVVTRDGGASWQMIPTRIGP
jgi:photosystem II stability/assembly factor-like uncharacterized protein